MPRPCTLYVRVWSSWLFARAEKYFSARGNSQLRQTIGYYVIDEGSCDESRRYGRNINGPSCSNYSFHTGSAEVNRKRKVHVNPPPIYRQSRGEGASEPKSVRPSQRVSEFPKELPHDLS